MKVNGTKVESMAMEYGKGTYQKPTLAIGIMAKHQIMEYIQVLMVADMKGNGRTVTSMVVALKYLPTGIIILETTEMESPLVMASTCGKMAALTRAILIKMELKRARANGSSPYLQVSLQLVAASNNNHQ